MHKNSNSAAYIIRVDNAPTPMPVPSLVFLLFLASKKININIYFVFRIRVKWLRMMKMRKFTWEKMPLKRKSVHGYALIGNALLSDSNPTCIYLFRAVRRTEIASQRCLCSCREFFLWRVKWNEIISRNPCKRFELFNRTWPWPLSTQRWFREILWTLSRVTHLFSPVATLHAISRVGSS